MPKLVTQVPTIRFTLPSSTEEEEAWVDMKTRATHGDVTHAQNAMVQVSMVDLTKPPSNGRRGSVVPSPDGQAGMLTEVEMAAFFNTFLARVIVDWNFTDEFGNDLKIEPRNIELLNAEDGDFLMKKAQLLLPGRKTDKERDFETPSRSPSPARAEKSTTEKRQKH